MAKNNNLSRSVQLLSRWAASIYLFCMTGFLAVSLALAVGLVPGLPPWWQTTLPVANALVMLLMLFVIQHTTKQQTGAINPRADQCFVRP